MELEYIIHGIFPKNKLHLVAGASGAGKTTMLFNMIRDWSAGLPVFGHISYPAPYQYVSLDRMLDEVDNRIEAAGLDPEKVNRAECLDYATVESLIAKYSEAEVLFLDGFGILMPDVNKYNGIAQFCRGVLALIKKRMETGRPLTIFGMCHSPKMKQGEGYSKARDKVLGSVAFGGFSSTLLYIDNVTTDPGDSRRSIQIEPRCAPPEEHIYVFTPGGSMIPCDLDKDIDVPALKFFLKVPLNEVMSAAQMESIGKEAGISRRTVFNYLEKWVKEGKILNEAHGFYFRPSQAYLGKAQVEG